MSLQVLANLPSVERMAAAKDLHKLLNKSHKHAYRLVSYTALVPVGLSASWTKSTHTFAPILFFQLSCSFWSISAQMLSLAVRSMSREAMHNLAGALDPVHMSWPHCGAPA